MIKTETVVIEGKKLKLSNPEKLLWPEAGIRKIDYLARMIELSPYLLPHAQDRLLTTIRYPDGIHGESFFSKNLPEYAPDWITKRISNDIEYAVLDSVPTLTWFVNLAALEFHTAFNTHERDNYPTSVVFDLDPSKGQVFEDVVEVALLVKETLDALGITSYIKTSGATGMQLYIPVGGKYDYDTARKINEFFGHYFAEKYPKLITIERMVEKRGTKLYFDYLQMWQGKTITMVYSPRAREKAPISMPVTWEEVRKGIKPEDFTINNALDRFKVTGDLFKPLLTAKEPEPSFEAVINEILKH
ncbi:MAG: non-homologous end-joining DNA ligase [Clostridia bacterium]|nr:non-homologous end-joining DNA ligase [Clostridia bacterium]